MSRPDDFIIENGVLIKYTGRDSQVVIPDGVTAIGKDAFHPRQKITELVIPDGVTAIGLYSFCGLRHLTRVRLPATLKELSHLAFASTPLLTYFQFPDDPKAAVAVWRLVWDHYACYMDKREALLISLLEDKSPMLRQKTVRALMRRYAESVATQIIREKGPMAALECLIAEFPKLDELVWQRSLALAQETGCTEAILLLLEKGKDEPTDEFDLSDDSKETRRVSEQAARRAALYQQEAKGLTIAVSGRMEFFSGKAQFQAFLKPYGVRLSSTVNRNTDFLICNDKKSTTEMMRHAADYGVPVLVEREFMRRLCGSDFLIEDGVLYGYCGDGGAVTIPDGVTSIRIGAFSDCHNLTSVVVPKGVTSIDPDAFRCCYNLTSLTLPAGLRYLGETAFYYSSRLSEIVLPEEDTEFDRVWHLVWMAARKMSHHGLLMLLDRMKESRQ